MSPGGKRLCACANPRAPLSDLQLQLDINPLLEFFLHKIKTSKVMSRLEKEQLSELDQLIKNTGA